MSQPEWLPKAIEFLHNEQFLYEVAGGFVAILIWEILKFLNGVRRTPKGRRKKLNGSWIGHGEDFYADKGAANLPFDVTIKFKVGSQNIKGEATLIAKTGEKETLELAGAFYKDTFVRLNYETEDRRQLGVIFLELSPSSNELDGTYTGFSPRRKAIVAGKVNLQRTGK